MKSFGAASEPAADLHAGPVAEEIEAIKDRARLVSAEVEAVFAPGRDGIAEPDAGSPEPS